MYKNQCKIHESDIGVWQQALNTQPANALYTLISLKTR